MAGRPIGQRIVPAGAIAESKRVQIFSEKLFSELRAQITAL
jgi:hypothetical protein